MSDIDFDKIRTRISRIKDTFDIPEKTTPRGYSAMEGGPVVPDSEHWYQRYQDSVGEVRMLRAMLFDYKDMVTRLISQLESLGVEPLVNSGE